MAQIANGTDAACRALWFPTTGARPVGVRFEGERRGLRRVLLLMERFGRVGVLLDGDVPPGGVVEFSVEGEGGGEVEVQAGGAFVPLRPIANPYRPGPGVRHCERRAPVPAEAHGAASPGEEAAGGATGTARSESPEDAMTPDWAKWLTPTWSDESQSLYNLEVALLGRCPGHGADWDRRSLAWFWWHFDGRTHPGLFGSRGRLFGVHHSVSTIHGEAWFRRHMVKEVARDLSRRTRLRHLAAIGNGEHEPPSAPGWRPRRHWLAYLSGIQLVAIEEFFPRCFADGIIESGAMGAFEAFASGVLGQRVTYADEGAGLEELRKIPLTEGAPEGPSLFLFAEFAFAAIREGVDAEQWTTLLPAMVGMQDIYRHAYGDPLRPQPMSYFRHGEGDGRPRTVTTKTLAAIRARHCAATTEGLRALMSEHLRRTFSEPYDLSKVLEDRA